jgi:hypothetical protein
MSPAMTREETAQPRQLTHAQLRRPQRDGGVASDLPSGRI